MPDITRTDSPSDPTMASVLICLRFTSSKALITSSVFPEWDMKITMSSPSSIFPIENQNVRDIYND